MYGVVIDRRSDTVVMVLGLLRMRDMAVEMVTKVGMHGRYVYVLVFGRSQDMYG